MYVLLTVLYSGFVTVVVRVVDDLLSTLVEVVFLGSVETEVLLPADDLLTASVDVPLEM